MLVFGMEPFSVRTEPVERGKAQAGSYGSVGTPPGFSALEREKHFAAAEWIRSETPPEAIIAIRASASPAMTAGGTCR